MTPPMKVAYFGYNAYSPCLDIFTRHGHEIAIIFTGKDSPHTEQVIQFAKQISCQLSFDKPDKHQMEMLIHQGVDLFFAAEYPWQIPIPDTLNYAINVHPTLLPYGRGPTPLPSLILKHPQQAGITLHKMTKELDKGDLLLQKTITLDANESFDSLSTKLFIETPALLEQLLSNLDHYYTHSTPQGEGSYWPKLTHQEQTIHWYHPTSTIYKRIRAFGSLGVYSEINGQHCLITAAECISYPHQFTPGMILSADTIKLTIASKDGFVCIPRKNLLTA